MQVTSIIAGQGGPVASLPVNLRAATATLNAPTDAANVTSQLGTYQALAGRWGDAGHAERAILAPALTGSAFAQRIQAVLNAFTRAAWAGPDAEPPAPQLQMLKAFDQLSDVDQHIVAAMQAGDMGAPSFTSPSRYRDQLYDNVRKAQADEALKRQPTDTVTLSAAAQARLAGEASTEASRDPTPTAPPANRDVATVLAAYARSAGSD